MAKILIEIDTEDVIGHGDIHWESWCESLSGLLWAARDGEPITLPAGVTLMESALAAEREACAKVAEAKKMLGFGEWHCGWDSACENIAEAIRARGME